MASKAEIGYAESIVTYFDRHPEAGIEVDVDDVLGDMSTWVARHDAARSGRPWLDDAARAAVRDELRDMVAELTPYRDAERDAQISLRDARGRRQPTDSLRAAWIGARADCETAQKSVNTRIRALCARYAEYDREVMDMAIQMRAAAR